MTDPCKMYPNGFHRTPKACRYNFIDFGLSRQYSSRDVLDEVRPGGDESAPEHQSVGTCNPFRTDIYYIGNLVRNEFVEVCIASLAV